MTQRNENPKERRDRIINLVRERLDSGGDPRISQEELWLRGGDGVLDHESFAAADSARLSLIAAGVVLRPAENGEIDILEVDDPNELEIYRAALACESEIRSDHLASESLAPKLNALSDVTLADIVKVMLVPHMTSEATHAALALAQSVAASNKLGPGDLEDATAHHEELEDQRSPGTKILGRKTSRKAIPKRKTSRKPIPRRNRKRAIARRPGFNKK